VRAGDVAGGADVADDLAGSDSVAGGQGDGALVGVPRSDAPAADPGEPAVGRCFVAAARAGGDDGAVGDGVDGSAGGGGEVETGVAVLPVGSALAEPSGQGVDVDR